VLLMRVPGSVAALIGPSETRRDIIMGGREEQAAERTTPQAPLGLGGGKSYFPATPREVATAANPPPQAHTKPTPSLPFHLLLVTSH
jgi:hypothetical protein